MNKQLLFFSMSTLLLTSGCSLLKAPLHLADGLTTTVGEVAAQEIDIYGPAIGDLVGVITGNPVIGAATAAGLLGISSLLFRRKTN